MVDRCTRDTRPTPSCHATTIAKVRHQRIEIKGHVPGSNPRQSQIVNIWIRIYDSPLGSQWVNKFTSCHDYDMTLSICYDCKLWNGPAPL